MEWKAESLVEVRVKGAKGISWFPAIVVRVGGRWCEIEYLTVLADDGVSRRREKIKKKALRPKPPVREYQVNEAVDIFLDTAWYSGIILPSSEPNKLNVFCQEDQKAFVSELGCVRPHREGCKNIPSTAAAGAASGSASGNK